MMVAFPLPGPIPLTLVSRSGTLHFPYGIVISVL